MAFYYDNNDDWFYSRCLGWKLKFAFLPKKCILSGKTIWLEYAYVGLAMFTGPGEPIFETNWHKKDEHLLWLLKK